MQHQKRYCLALDLKDDPAIILGYETLHQSVSPEIQKSIRDAGITVMDIYRVGNRLFMIMEVDETFSFGRKEAMDEANEAVQVWEKLTWEYQQALPFAGPGEKWMVMKQIFALDPEGD